MNYIRPQAIKLQPGSALDTRSLSHRSTQQSRRNGTLTPAARSASRR